MNHSTKQMATQSLTRFSIPKTISQTRRLNKLPAVTFHFHNIIYVASDKIEANKKCLSSVYMINCVLNIIVTLTMYGLAFRQFLFFFSIIYGFAMKVKLKLHFFSLIVYLLFNSIKKPF